MAGGVTVPAVCCSPPLLLPPLLLLLLLLLLPPAGSAAAAAAATADSRCVKLLNSTIEHGQRRSNVLIDRTCGCESLSLHVKLNGSNMPVDCDQNGSWHDTKQNVSVTAGRATFRTVVAGCFESRCTCTSGDSCHEHWHFDGLDYSVYNLVISAVQRAGWPLSVDVHIRPDKNANQFYFPQLAVRLYGCPREENAKARDGKCLHDAVVSSEIANATADVRVVLTDLRTPGPYRLEVFPSGSWVCQGSNTGCRRIELFKNLTDAPRLPVAELPSDDRMKALYAVIGVTLAVIAAGLVFLWRECSVVRPGQGAPFVAKAPAPSGAQVLLVHLWAGQRLAQLKSELRDAGLQVTDFQEKKMASLLRTIPVADVLTTDRLRHAKLVFLCSERALQLERSPTATGSGGGRGPRGAGSCENGAGGFSTAAGSLLGHEAVFNAVLHCVRNSALAQNYQRVFVVLPEGSGGDDAGPAALVPGCRFRWPADGPELIRQLSLSPAETDRERVV